jgi:hypothetical protein
MLCSDYKAARRIEYPLSADCCAIACRAMVISQRRVDAIGDCLIHELCDCKLAGPVNTNKEIELALDRLNFRNIDMKEADRVSEIPCG